MLRRKALERSTVKVSVTHVALLLDSSQWGTRNATPTKVYTEHEGLRLPYRILGLESSGELSPSKKHTYAYLPIQNGLKREKNDPSSVSMTGCVKPG